MKKILVPTDFSPCVMVDAYGAYAEALTPEMAAKLGSTNAA